MTRRARCDRVIVLTCLSEQAGFAILAGTPDSINRIGDLLQIGVTRALDQSRHDGAGSRVPLQTCSGRLLSSDLARVRRMREDDREQQCREANHDERAQCAARFGRSDRPIEGRDRRIAAWRRRKISNDQLRLPPSRRGGVLQRGEWFSRVRLLRSGASGLDESVDLARPACAAWPLFAKNSWTMRERTRVGNHPDVL
jgi:hypothetical protein